MYVCVWRRGARACVCVRNMCIHVCVYTWMCVYVYITSISFTYFLPYCCCYSIFYLFSIRFLFFVVVLLSLILSLPFPALSVNYPKCCCLFFGFLHFRSSCFSLFLYIYIYYFILFFKSVAVALVLCVLLLLLLFMFYLSISFYHNISLWMSWLLVVL